jgi:hypothetical protein
MRPLFIRILPSVLALAALLVPARSCQAQAIWSGEFERAMGPGATVPHDGVSPFVRYNYYAGPALYLNADARRLYLLDYYDRLDRAQRFGYPPPPPPELWPTSRCNPRRVHWCIGAGFSSR